MNENRRQILEMLAAGKITADEAERLMGALDSGRSTDPAEPNPAAQPKYLRVLVESDDDPRGDGPSRVNVRVPMQLLRAGVRLASLIPVQAHHHVNDALRDHGMHVDLSQIKPENLEEIVDQLKDLTVDVAQGANKVRVFCE